MTTLQDLLDSFSAALRAAHDFDVPPHTTQADEDGSKKLLADCETLLNLACIIAEEVIRNRSHTDGTHIFESSH